MSERLLLVHHEAAHCVARLHLGLDPRDAGIVGEMGRGCNERDEVVVAFSSEDAATVHLVGVFAEVEWARLHVGDAAAREALMETTTERATWDITRPAIFAQTLGEGHQRVEAAYQNLFDALALRLVRECWLSITALAAALLERGSLTIAEQQALIAVKAPVRLRDYRARRVAGGRGWTG